MNGDRVGLVPPEVTKNRVRLPHPKQVLGEANLLDPACRGRFDITLNVLAGKRSGIRRALYRVTMGMQVKVVITHQSCPIREPS